MMFWAGSVFRRNAASPESCGVFLQITSDDAEDVAIPDTPYGFATLKTAQANGDFAALSSRGRRLLRLHLSADIAEGLAALAAAL